MTDKIKCSECGWFGRLGQELTAESPFLPDDEITGCPKCFAINTLMTVCDEPSCLQLATSGWPDGDTYRYTCREHRKK